MPTLEEQFDEACANSTLPGSTCQPRKHKLLVGWWQILRHILLRIGVLYIAYMQSQNSSKPDQDTTYRKGDSCRINKMPTLEEQFDEACANSTLPGTLLMASDRTGAFEYKKAFGNTISKDGATNPLPLDATLIIASCTKLMTTIAALQCVERGLLELDSDISSILVEYKNIDILTGFDESTGKPVLKRAENYITLRNLLTHTSGIAYDLGNPLLIQWRKYHGIELSLRGLPLVERAFCPLVFEPGTGWEYGYSLDWVGQIVSRVNGGISLQEYMKKNIWEPLQINNMTFHIEQRPDMWERLHRMSARDGPTNPIFGTSTAPSSAKVGPTDRELYEIPIVDEYGGHGVLSSAPDYFKVLRSIIVNDGGLLRPDTVDEMFKPQLGTASKAVLQNAFSVPELNRTFGWLPPNTGANWGLGGLLIEDDLPTGRKRGSMNWSGLPNLIWWIDRETGLYGLSATQLVPYGDEKFQAMHQAFETEMYSRYSELEKS